MCSICVISQKGLVLWRFVNQEKANDERPMMSDEATGDSTLLILRQTL